MTSSLHNKIISIVGKKNFLISDKEKTPYTTGWRTKSGECEFVVLPNSLINMWAVLKPVSYTHLRAHETVRNLV